MFITFAFYSITATFGGFAINWPDTIKEILKTCGIVNFQWNLMFFSCHDPRPTFMENWVNSADFECWLAVVAACFPFCLCLYCIQ